MIGPRPPGFALVEVLVATTILLILTGGILMVVSPTGVGFSREPAANDVQERLRGRVEALRQPLLEAGSGPGVVVGAPPLGLVIPAVMPYRIGRHQADPPGTVRQDLVTIVSSPAASAAPTLISDFAGNAGTVAVETPPGCPLGNAACGLDVGMTVLLLDASG